jgi:hypothetical protein
LTLIVGPSEETSRIGEEKQELAERHRLRERFWAGLLERARARTALHAGVSPSRDNWIATSAGKGGLLLSYVVRQHDADAHLYIDRGPAHGDQENARIFEALRAQRERIEHAFGAPLRWQALEGKRACRIASPQVQGGYKDDEVHWPRIQDEMIEAMVRLEAALRPHLDALAL